MTTEEQSNTNVKQTENWAEGWVKKDLVSPSPFAQENITDEQLDTAIDAALESPEVSAMLENAAADVADDAINTGEASDDFAEIGGERGLYLTVDAPTRAEFDAFVTRVEKAFKHAGFKF